MSLFNLPEDVTQCVHVGFEPELVHCVAESVSTDRRHGWLCHEHYSRDFMSRDWGVKKVSPPRNIDSEIIAHILLTEHRAIRSRVRTEVQVGAKVKISFLG